ncbi:MAG: biotin carboxylase N-terminal domain-containing protein [Pseudomonadota bacterium]
MKKVLIANRGEIACRVIRACRSLGLECVAVHSEADAGSLHVSLADEAHLLGPAKAAESYLKVDRILEAAKESGADAIHPGYGFLAENADFARAVEAAGLTWVGPSPDTIVDMGDKERARLLAKAAGVPILPGSARFAEGEVGGLAEAGEAVGYPLLVKASAGGGGIGMRLVENPDDLEKVVTATQGMAGRAFGDGAVFLERYVRRARHVEIQVFGLGDGRAVHFFERECSIQRRFQKIIEESPAPGLPEETRQAMGKAAVDLAAQERYRGAGTVEFVVDGESGEFFFLEMNTRIQVEHPVSEMITGADLVALQLRLAAGAELDLSQEAIQRQGHAIECRLYAENPAKMFLPQPGPLERLVFPEESEGVRIETGVRQGDKITAYYDPMIAKVVCHGVDRDAAIARSLQTLKAIELEGIVTNLAFLIRTLDHPAFRAGESFTGFVDAHKAELIG